MWCVVCEAHPLHFTRHFFTAITAVPAGRWVQLHVSNVPPKPMPPLAARLVCGAVWVEAPNDIRWLQVNGWFGQPSLRAPRSSSSSSRGTPSAAAGNVTGSVEVLAPEADLWQLSPEETLYLCSLGTIVLTEEDGDRISAMRYESAWQRLRQLQPNLAHTYAAYAYWRERGWVPRPGLQYGATFLLYRVGVGSAARHTHAE